MFGGCCIIKTWKNHVAGMSSRLHYELQDVFLDSGKDINVMEFRKLTISDWPSLLELYKQLDEYDEQSTFEQSEMVWKEIEENSNIQYFGAIENGKVVSTCYAVYIPNLTRGNRWICFIENVVTDKEHRNCGLASKVIDMAVDFAKEHHCYKVILQSGIARTKAHQLYENKGFNGASKKAFDLRLE